jgi:hypothetical protein
MSLLIASISGVAVAQEDSIVRPVKRAAITFGARLLD